MGKLVAEALWLPSRLGGWHVPSELTLEDLPDGFEQSEMVAEKLGMRSSALAQLARQKNVDPDKLQILLEHISDPELERFIAQKKKAATARSSVPAQSLQNHLEQFDSAFNRRGSDSTPSHSVIGGSVQNGEVRERRLQDQLHDARVNEPLPEQRLRVVPREVWEKKDGIVRTKMREYYGGRCQICTWTFPKADGEPYFEGLYCGITHAAALARSSG